MSKTSCIDRATLVQLSKKNNHCWTLSMSVPDFRHEGSVTYTLHINDFGGLTDRNLGIDTEDGEHYIVVPNSELEHIYENDPNDKTHLTMHMASAFGFVPNDAVDFLTARWDAINLLVVPASF